MDKPDAFLLQGFIFPSFSTDKPFDARRIQVLVPVGQLFYQIIEDTSLNNTSSEIHPFWTINMRGRDHLEDLDVAGRIILKLVLKK
jgi:hypothetical protein